MPARPRFPSSVGPLVWALAAAACEAAPPDPPASQLQIASQTGIEDSAGILIVKNARPEAGSRLGWQVTPEPAVSIGTIEGGEDFQLHWVDDGLKLRDGRIVVANGGSHQLLVFDEAGNYPTAWGQRGEGPGDFGGSWGSNGLGPSQLFWMEHWPGDSLAVCHAVSSAGATRFVFVWDTRGNFGRRLNLARDGRVPRCQEALPGGGILALHWLRSPPIRRIDLLITYSH